MDDNKGMTISIAELEKELHSLPVTERARLADLLLESLDEPAQAEIDKAWIEEAESRIAAFEQGKLPAVDAEEVFRKAQKIFN